MGIRKLNKFLILRESITSYRNIPDFVSKLKSTDPNNTNNKKIIIAIDFWLYVHKYLHSCRSSNVMLGFWNQIMKFFSCGVIPLYVMDGTVPLEKQEKSEERAKKRVVCKKRIEELKCQIEEYVNLSDMNDMNDSQELNALESKKEKLQKRIKKIKVNDLYNIYKMFDMLSVPYIKAEYEADALCAKLFKENIITACMSDDMDMLALGCGSTIKFHEGKLIEFDLLKIKQDLEFDQEQFIDMCIMFGCDYLHHPFRLNCNDVYEMIKKHGSLLDALFSNEHEIFNMNNNNVNVIGEHYYRVKDIYMHTHKNETIPPDLYDFKMNHIIFNDLLAFIKKCKLFELNSTNLHILETNINHVNQLINDDIM
jgi:5'-3' exonuclease